MTTKDVIIMQTDIFLSFWWEIFLSTARVFRAKALLKTVATAATTKRNVPCK